MQSVQALDMRTELCRPEPYPGFNNCRLPTATILPSGSFEPLESDSRSAGGSRSSELHSPEAVNIDLERIVADFYGSLGLFSNYLTLAISLIKRSLPYLRSRLAR